MIRRLAILIALFSFGASVAYAAPTYDVNVDGHVRKTVLVIGDSNIERGATQLTEAFTDRADAYIPILTPRSKMGIRGYAGGLLPTSADFWQVRLPQVLNDVQPDVIVVELGINDTFQPGTATTSGYSSYGQKINWLLDLLPAGAPVLWSNLPCAIEPEQVRAGCKAINGTFPYMTSRLAIVNWAAVANGHPGYMLSGQDHLSPAGYTAYASTVVKALDALLP